jgi:hypothetical protein
MSAGTPFLFELRAQANAIAGFGYFASFSVLPDWLAWDTFGEAFDGGVAGIHCARSSARASSRSGQRRCRASFRSRVRRHARPHTLRRPRRGCHREHLPALGTSTTHPTRASDRAGGAGSTSRPHRIHLARAGSTSRPRWIHLALAPDPPAGVDPDPAAAARPLRDPLGHDPAARWIRLRAPLKPRAAAASREPLPRAVTASREPLSRAAAASRCREPITTSTPVTGSGDGSQ